LTDIAYAQGSLAAVLVHCEVKQERLRWKNPETSRKEWRHDPQ
jgi:hypothetical protein